MLWLGYHNNLNFKYQIKNIFFREKKKKKQLNLLFKTQKLLKLTYFKFYFPFTWSLKILKNKTYFYYFYSLSYYFNFPLPFLKQPLKIYWGSGVLLINTTTSFTSLKLFLKSLFTIFSLFTRILFTKLNFRGKGYYIYKNKRNTLTPQFGHAHRIYNYSYFIAVSFLSKTKVFFFGLSKIDLVNAGYNFYFLKPINIFTGRGVRFSKQLCYRKKGKISTYI